MNKETALRVARACYPNDSIDSVSLVSRARLWAGMGNIYQVSWKSGSNNNNKKSSIIVKYVHPRLSSGKLSIGDQRKLDSYIVESNFYEQFAPNLHSVEDVPLPPPPYHTERNLSDKTHPTIIIAMGELQQSPAASGGYDNDTHKDVMTWLAKFHAATWQSTTTELQPVGSYWHLDTRPNEWQDMPRHGWEGRLKKAARAIDERLKRDPLQCLVHGDTKDANILYSNNIELAFCDFQYVGRGPPSRDLSYYFCSSHVDDYEELVQFYFDSLLQHLTARGINAAALPTRQQLDDSLELAFCDFCRFMAGWGYWGYDLSRQVKVTLDKLDGGNMLKTEQDYQEAMERVFG